MTFLLRTTVREKIDGSAGQTFNPGSLSQIVSPNELLQENE
ncbi:hypothetical protein ECDEC8E_5146 [Escherichia coli DEC8E]|nr:hypothetical protein ECDEC8E_5146 [Escherichia coli DEC8E]